MTTRILCGDCRAILPTLTAGSVQCCITSPPYFGLRDYGTAEWDGGDPACDHRHETAHQKQGASSQRNGRANVEEQRNENFCDRCGKCGAVRIDQQIGLESSVDAYVAALVAVFRGVRRALADDGTLWLNLGDSYATGGTRQGNATGGIRNGSAADGHRKGDKRRNVPDGLKEKDLVGIPWRVAFALQADGWYLRSDIIWHKPNPMPESVTDRPTKAHEYIFLLSKRPNYYYDAEAVKEPAIGADRVRSDRFGGNKYDGTTTMHSDGSTFVNATARNRRSVWTVATQPYKGAHFATFPPDLIEPCIKAGTSERGQCPACGKPWRRVIQPSAEYAKRLGRGYHNHEADAERGMMQGKRADFKPVNAEYLTVGWDPSCACDAGDPMPQTVLDPFFGAGTTGLVADRIGRHCVGIELNPTYAKQAKQRVFEDAPLFAQVAD